jgi:hypothetical protein
LAPAKAAQKTLQRQLCKHLNLRGHKIHCSATHKQVFLSLIPDPACGIRAFERIPIGFSGKRSSVLLTLESMVACALVQPIRCHTFSRQIP